jgi:hypothetical protein
MITVTQPVTFLRIGHHGSKVGRLGAPAPRPMSRVQRVSRMMALAIQFDELIRTGIHAALHALENRLAVQMGGQLPREPDPPGGPILTRWRVRNNPGIGV